MADKMTGDPGDFKFYPPPRDVLALTTRYRNGDLAIRTEPGAEGYRLKFGKAAHRHYVGWLAEANITPGLEPDVKPIPGVPAVELFVFLKEATLGLTPDQSEIQPMTPARRRAFAQLMREVDEAHRYGYIIDIPE